MSSETEIDGEKFIVNGTADYDGFSIACAGLKFDGRIMSVITFRRSFSSFTGAILSRRTCGGIGSFATKNSISLGRFRVKNATVRAGKSLCYGLRL